jgi:ornithine cyclodeaminase/alanine dehydrogenase-like protein (mu-crystallin family)
VYLDENDVERLLSPEDAVREVESALLRLAGGAAHCLPRSRLAFDAGALTAAQAVDAELGLAGSRTTASAGTRSSALLTLFGAGTADPVAVVEASRIARLAAAGASAVAARHLANRGARSLGVIGCGPHARAQVDAIRVALPAIERVVAYCRTDASLRSFCDEVGAEAAESSQDTAEQDVVVTATTSRDPVLRGEWLREGALLCAVGADGPGRRELDNVVLERAAFVCCESVRQARLEATDLIEPVETGSLDWLEVHELQEVAAGAVSGRLSSRDVVVFTSTGLAAWDLALGALAASRSV